MTSNETATVTLISNSGDGQIKELEIRTGTKLSDFLDRHEPAPLEHVLVRVNRSDAPMDYTLKSGDKVVVSPKGIKGEQTIKCRNQIWRIHMHDDDPFPSSPHAHNMANGLKLDMRNGDLYRKGKVVDKLPKKKLIQLRKKTKKRPLPDLEI